MIKKSILSQILHGLDGCAAEQLAVVTDEGCIVVPAAARPIGGQPPAFLCKILRVPDGLEIIFAHRSDTHMLLKTRINISPGIDTGH